MPDVIEMLIKLFTDDAKMCAVVSNQADEQTVPNSLNCTVKMLFNIIKCHQLHEGKRDRGTKYTMTSNNQVIELEKVKNEKAL